MTAKHHIDDNARLIITSWKGAVNDINLIDAVREYQNNIQCEPDYIDYNEVVDLSEATDFQLTTKGLINIGNLAAMTDQSNPKRKLALIIHSNKALFLARMYISYRSLLKKSTKEIQAFSKKDKAFEWVQKNSE